MAVTSSLVLDQIVIISLNFGIRPNFGLFDLAHCNGHFLSVMARPVTAVAVTVV